MILSRGDYVFGNVMSPVRSHCGGYKLNLQNLEPRNNSYHEPPMISTFELSLPEVLQLPDSYRLIQPTGLQAVSWLPSAFYGTVLLRYLCEDEDLDTEDVSEVIIGWTRSRSSATLLHILGTDTGHYLTQLSNGTIVFRAPYPDNEQDRRFVRVPLFGSNRIGRDDITLRFTVLVALAGLVELEEPDNCFIAVPMKKHFLEFPSIASLDVVTSTVLIADEMKHPGPHATCALSHLL